MPEPIVRKRGSRKSIAFVPSSSLSKPATEENKENGGSKVGASKKSRSKSLGPGELQSAVNDQKQEKVIKSILQPPIPISPLQQIPSFNSKSKLKALAPPIMVPLKTEKEQQQARQQREAQRSAAMSHRENRRKSLGGRRVSFNPEVTMHVLEEMRISNTPPSNETNNTKTPATSSRAAAAATPTPANNDTAASSEAESSDAEHPSTPEKQVEHEVPEPESARLEHKKENRKPMTPMARFDQTEEFTGSPTPSSVFSSPAMTDDAESVLAPEDSSDEDDTGLISVVSPSVTARTDASDDDDDDSDGMDIVDENEVTATFTPWIAREHNHPRLSHPETNFTSAPPRPQDSNPEMPFSGRRHDHPRLSHPERGFSSAPRTAELMRQDEDEDEATMEITRVVGRGVITSPSPARGAHDLMDDDMTMEFTQAIGPGILSNRRLSTVSEGTDDGEMTMEITRAIGPGLLSARTQSITQSIAYPKLPRFSPDEDGDEQTMELTRAIGGIKSVVSPGQGSDDGDEDMSMELTNVIGGVLASRRQSEPEDENTTRSMDMDMTVAIGGIIEQARFEATATIPEVEEPQSPTADLTAVTMHVNPSLSALVAEARARSASVTSTPPAAETPKRGRPKGSATPQKSKEATPKSLGRSLRSRTTTPQDENPVEAEPVVAPEPVAPVEVEAEVSTPKAASRTPKITNSTKKSTTKPTPKTTTTPKMTPKTATPRRSLRTPQQGTPTPKATALAGTGKVAVLDHGLSAKRRIAGIISPGVHLTNMNMNAQSPSTRGPTGVGISKPGMGSPSVRKILSARKPIATSEVQPFSPGVRPLSQLLKDLKDEKKEGAAAAMFESPEGAKGAKGIKEMLERMTPKKGLDAISTGSVGRPKRSFDAVKGDLMAAAAEASSLEAGPSGSPARKKRRSLEEQPTPVPATTPAAEKPSVRFEVQEAPKERKKDEDVFGPSRAVITPAKSAPPPQVDTESAMDLDTQEEDEADVPNMPMKEFLSMIGISFLDGITSTKHRRQTGAILGLGVEMNDEEVSIGDQINGQLTIRPFLELYEHLQRELKRSNKEGKEMFKQIEKMVLEENPRLFREYLLAPPDVRAVMDLQFKNIKSSSRLEARGDWYTWRQGLQETIKAKALENLESLKVDEGGLKKWREVVDKLGPGLEERKNELEEKLEVLKIRKEEIEGCDPKELEEKREALKNAKKRLEEKKKELERLNGVSEELEGEVRGREERRETCLSAIESAERVAEANKGYTEEEVVGSIDRVRQLEEKTGWMLKKAESPCFLEMVYKKVLAVRFNAQRPDNKESPVELTLLNTTAPTPQQKFFIEAIQTSAREAGFKRFKDMLKHISERWDRASALLEEMGKIAGPYPSTISFENGWMVFMADMLVMERKAKVRVRFSVSGEDIMRQVGIRAEAVYGEGMSGWKLDEYLERVVSGEGMGWREAMGSLGRQLSGK
ncbi:hypothetical protein TWF225_002118 [Orbilia oligospora]|nr:hypothetical protein TWF225_002118 [Orbilia oligospora]KAF3242770.1 hypothetical protein TWF217_011478 [Orbilia oligospora]KAF3258033.1 hypothetical protein TWF128_004929 [Orbilia oligospora]KAF3280029.1 hypothetical protein TWF132_011880 [Orbilia oligospora]